MRQELHDMLLLDWGNEENWPKTGEIYGYGPHVEAVVAMKPTPEERREIGQMLLECEDRRQMGTLTGVMEEEPDPAYLPFLATCLESDNQRKVSYAMRALLRGAYEGAWDLLFSRPDLQKAMGDEFPDEIWGSAGDLPEEWQRQVLERFNERFSDDPPFNAYTHQWLRTLANIPVTDAATVKTMLRTWNRLHRNDHQQRYLLMQAMSAAPAPEYLPIFERVARSKLFDIRDMAKKGLAKLKNRE